MKKLTQYLLIVAAMIGLSILVGHGCDGEMLYECHQMQQWQDEGHPNKIPEYCYELGLPRR